MKIRAGFVSNSSSTSFLIIAKEEFRPESLRRLMGVSDSSPLAGIFEQLYADLIDGTEVTLDMKSIPANEDVSNHFHMRRDNISSHMLERLNAERGKDVKAYIGYLDSESNTVEAFFCTDSFEEENDQIYINGLDCAW